MKIYLKKHLNFATENIDIKIAKTLLLAQQSDNDELRTSIAILIKQLLYLAKNEQLFSSLLQLLFSEPENIELCAVILKVHNANDVLWMCRTCL